MDSVPNIAWHWMRRWRWHPQHITVPSFLYLCLRAQPTVQSAHNQISGLQSSLCHNHKQPSETLSGLLMSMLHEFEWSRARKKMDIFDILEENVSITILIFIDATQHANLHLCLVFSAYRVYSFIGHLLKSHHLIQSTHLVLKMLWKW